MEDAKEILGKLLDSFRHAKPNNRSQMLDCRRMAQEALQACEQGIIIPEDIFDGLDESERGKVFGATIFAVLNATSIHLAQMDAQSPPPPTTTHHRQPRNHHHMKRTPIAALVSHCLWQNQPALQASRMNCHTMHVHSIMLCDVPGNRVRLFIPMPEHDLYKNFPGVVQNYASTPQGGSEMSVGFHAHHCDLTLACVYDSKLTGGDGGFIKRGQTWLNSESTTFVRAGDSIQVEAKEIHTVAVDSGEMAAWLVFEGKEDPEYIPRTYSNADLEKHDSSGLYVPMSEGDIRQLLRLVDLL